MGRGPEKHTTKMAKAAALIADFLGTSEEDIRRKFPVETVDEQMAEIQSIITYYDVSGVGFKEKQCKNCGRMFAYSWDRDVISYCSITCGVEALEKIGIKRDPTRDVKQRYGKTAPAVVPPDALEVLKELVSSE